MIIFIHGVLAFITLVFLLRDGYFRITPMLQPDGKRRDEYNFGLERNRVFYILLIWLSFSLTLLLT